MDDMPEPSAMMYAHLTMAIKNLEQYRDWAQMSDSIVVPDQSLAVDEVMSDLDNIKDSYEKRLYNSDFEDTYIGEDVDEILDRD